jgi:three-Cys-motif partner protein
MSTPTQAIGRNLPDDDLHLPKIKQHSLEKLRRHDHYATAFVNALKINWPQLAYVALCSGAGRARLNGTDEIVETAAMSALRLPFTHYVFVDSSKKCIDALRKRVTAAGTTASVTYVDGDVNDCAAQVAAALPKVGRGRPGLLSLCFVDPYDAKVKFRTIRALARQFRMDFLILLALGHDVRRNLPLYRDQTNTVIDDLIDCPTWREEFAQFDPKGKEIERFILMKYDTAMKRLRYQPAAPEDHHAVKVSGMGVRLYYLVLYSKNPLGKKLWKATLGGTSPQQHLELG